MVVLDKQSPCCVLFGWLLCQLLCAHCLMPPWLCDLTRYSSFSLSSSVLLLCKDAVIAVASSRSPVPQCPVILFYLAFLLALSSESSFLESCHATTFSTFKAKSTEWGCTPSSDLLFSKSGILGLELMWWYLRKWPITWQVNRAITTANQREHPECVPFHLNHFIVCDRLNRICSING
jgi:hypothetical protein